MSAKDSTQQRDIYVALLGGGKDVWLQVRAVYEGEDAYRIISCDPHPHHRLEYTTGEYVRCRTTRLPGLGKVLVATERLHRRDPEEPGGPE